MSLHTTIAKNTGIEYRLLTNGKRYTIQYREGSKPWAISHRPSFFDYIGLKSLATYGWKWRALRDLKKLRKIEAKRRADKLSVWEVVDVG